MQITGTGLDVMEVVARDLSSRRWLRFRRPWSRRVGMDASLVRTRDLRQVVQPAESVQDLLVKETFWWPPAVAHELPYKGYS